MLASSVGARSALVGLPQLNVNCPADADEPLPDHSWLPGFASLQDWLEHLHLGIEHGTRIDAMIVKPGFVVALGRESRNGRESPSPHDHDRQ